MPFARVVLLSVSFAWLAARLATAAEFPGTIVLGRPTNTSIAANFVAPAASTVYVEYGTQAGAYSGQSDLVTLAANVPREVTLSGLTANTRYYYRIRFRAAAATTDHEASPEYSFMTA